MATVSDRPGGIARLTTLLGNNGASIKDIYHERAFLHANIDHVRVKVVIELQGKDHAQRIQQILIAEGYNPVWDDDNHKKMIYRGEVLKIPHALQIGHWVTAA